ncbi:MAG: RlmE family RNA methyltransferase [Candidatus Peribacteraceae bacterium]|nr:RlmE family RNA methyltransferase [Candidatus Peribacteraceae bacterium]
MSKPYIPNDRWSKKAAKEGFRARSVYKLMELDDRFSLLKHGMTVLDLGAAPGSWLQYTSKRIGTKGRAIGIDITPIESIGENVSTHAQDISDANAVAAILDAAKIKTVDLVLSDIAPSTSGVRDVDQWRSIELNQAVVDIAERFLKPGGVCVLKVFRGADFDSFLFKLKQTWKKVKPAQVAASRDRSKEIYIVLWKKGGK